MAHKKNIPSDPQADVAGVKECEVSQEREDKVNVGGVLSFEATVPKMEEKDQEEDEVCREEDIYRFDSRSSLRGTSPLTKRTREVKKEKADLTFQVEKKSLENVSSTNDETNRLSDITEASKNMQVSNRLEEERSEEGFVGSLGNSLTGMQGWSSDFNGIPVPESSLTDLRENQEGDSTTGSENPINGSHSVEESHSQSTGEIDKQKITEEQTRYPDMIEDFEVIPITNGPLSQYADDRTQALLEMVTKIGREKGLAAQKFQCRGCSCELGIIFGKHKVCTYDGYYYCSECHVDELAVIPARILYNWDFRKHPVARHTKLFLNQIEDMALIDVEKCNPSLYTAVSEMDQIQVLRKQIFYLKAYLFTCKQSVAEELRSKIWPREYMLENCHTYSVHDLMQVQNGSLGPQLKKIIVFAAKHVQQCALCSQKGFICEICENPKIIYPFDTDLTVRCDKCRSVFHRACKTDIKPCPRCLRRKQRSSGCEDTVATTEFPSPFI